MPPLDVGTSHGSQLWLVQQVKLHGSGPLTLAPTPTNACPHRFGEGLHESTQWLASTRHSHSCSTVFLELGTPHTRCHPACNTTLGVWNPLKDTTLLATFLHCCDATRKPLVKAMAACYNLVCGHLSPTILGLGSEVQGVLTCKYQCFVTYARPCGNNGLAM